MKFSKRPQPVSFGEPEPGLEPENEGFGPGPQPVGFRPLDVQDGPMAIHGLSTQVARNEPDNDAYAPEFEFEETPPAGWATWIIAVGVAVLWAAGPIAFAVGYRARVSPLQDDRFALAVFALLALGPAIFVLGAAYLIRQGQKLAWQARRAKAMAHDMLSPALLAAARAGDVTQAVRDEILRAGHAAEEARETLTALREALAFETDKLTGATAHSVRTAEELAKTLGRERAEMGGMAQALDVQATRLADTVAQQARMVTEAVTVAETQIREAESALSARAADLAAAAGETRDITRAAGEDLTRHIARLETAGAGVAEQVKAVETGLGAQRTALVALSETLRADHEAFARNADTHAARLAEFIESARTSSSEMAQRAGDGGEALRRLMADAALQFRDLAETAKAEREEFGQSTLQSLEAVAASAAEQRAALDAEARGAIEALAAAAEETRAAAARHAQAARAQVDQLSEAAFAAGQRANQVFEARLEEARALIGESSKLVEDAGAAAARKLDEGAARARATMEELTALLTDLEARAAKLPAEAQQQAEMVRATVSDGLDELRREARRTAEQAEAIDAAFQDRVRRNFEMLSEAVRLMGAAAASPPPPIETAPPPETAPSLPLRRARAAPVVEPEPLLLDTPSEDQAAAAALADRIGLRNRIRLTPTATDAEFSAVFKAAAGAEPPAARGEDEDSDDAWTWKDLLASLDGEGGEGEALEDALAGDLAKMGVDPGRLLPTARVEEIAALVAADDGEAARELVRRLAPAATRRIARRLFTDDDVKRRTQVYVRRYKTLLGEAASHDPEGGAVAELLVSDAGRIFLLLDAAAGDSL